MANEPTIADRLKRISDARVFEKYETTIGKDVALVRSLAKSLLTYNLGELLPPATAIPFGGINVSQEDANTALRSLVIRASNNTKGIDAILEQMSKLPDNNDQFVNLQGTFMLQAGWFLETWNALIPALRAASGVNELDQARKDVERTREMVNASEHANSQIKALLEASQDASKKIGGAHSGAFAKLSEDYQKQANYWLYVTAGTACAFIAVIIIFAILGWIFPVVNYNQLIEFVVSRVLTLGVIYYLMVLAARTYRANAHLAAVNLHRATALQVFATFANAPSNPETQNAILLETTRCIYSHTSTGYLGGEEVSSPIQIVEILKALGPGSKA